MNVIVKDEVNLKIPVECYSRVVGYFRPVEQWNIGKKEEFAERVNIEIGYSFK